MLDMGFIRDIRRIMEALPEARQNLLFSATYTKEVRELADSLLNEPVFVEVARRNAAADTVRQTVYEVEQERKRSLLVRLLASQAMTQVLVFCRTKQGANRLARDLLREGINAVAIHSDKLQAAREQALAEFKDGRVNVLVATDIAARGLDIAELPHVINFDIPHAPEDYVHRIGRTGRAGLAGDAISLAAPEEMKFLKDIEKLLKREIPRAARPVAAAKNAPHAAADPIFTQPYEPAPDPGPRAPAPRRIRAAKPLPVLFRSGTKSAG